MKGEDSIFVAATFTVDPMLAPLRAWLKLLGVEAAVHAAPYNQFFHAFHEPESVRGGVRLLRLALARPEDWARDHSGPDHPAASRDVIEQRAEELIAALGRTGAVAANTLLLVCPASPQFARESWLRRVEQGLVGSVNGMVGMRAILVGHEPEERAALGEIHDTLRDEMGHVPYTPATFNWLAMLAARHLSVRQRPPVKVVVLDCDNTLWNGVCAEAGASGVLMDPPYVALQRFMLAQREAGRLLCLCSRNAEADVWAVFDQRPDMVLRRGHFTAWRINWEPKASNLRALARELNLGLDSIVFVDDDPAQCAAARAGCPEVLTLSLPPDPLEIPRFLASSWAFDHSGSTEDDPLRASRYQDEAARRSFQDSSRSYREFLEGLRLEVVVDRAQKSDLPRFAQLTRRTNQFNFGARGRTEEELARWLEDPSAELWITHVRDRFGDYGLVGAMATRAEGDVLAVDHFMLSCRALGRGAEHRMAAFLGGQALARSLSAVRLDLTPTERNVPAASFLRAVGGDRVSRLDGRLRLILPSNEAAALRFEPEAATGTQAEPDTGPSRAGALPRNPDWLGETGRLTRDAQTLHEWLTGRAAPAPVPAVSSEEQVRRIIAAVLGAAPRDLPSSALFADLGVSSSQLMTVMERMEAVFGTLPRGLLYNHPSIEAVGRFLSAGGVQPLRPASEPEPRRASDDPVAIVGLSGRYPGSPDLEKLWDNLLAGNRCTGERPGGRPGLDRGGFLGGVDEFDAGAFRLTPSQAARMDPQQRLFLETAWETMESAGHTPATLGRNVGVFVGAGNSGYDRLAGHEDAETDLADTANRVSFAFDFIGPSIAVDTACSGSLTALHLAVRSLRAGECDAALAGGVSVLLAPDRLQRAGRRPLLSAAGRCDVFGADSDGLVDAEGAGAVLLRPLDRAEAEGDPILGVIRGAWVNSSGRTTGFGAPNATAAAALLRHALSETGVTPSSISYVEASANGSPASDTAELDALAETLGGRAPGELPCHVGSMKASLGNTNAAAGLAGLTRVLLQMEHGKITPHPDAIRLRPDLNLENGSIRVATQPVVWRRTQPGEPRRAIVDSFGGGGANAVALLEDYVSTRAQPDSKSRPHLFPLSADTAAQLRVLTERMKRWLESHDPDLAEMAWTLQRGREPRPHRMAVIAEDRGALLRRLGAFIDGEPDSEFVAGIAVARLADLLGGGPEEAAFLRSLRKTGKLATLARLWVEGARIDWSLLHDPPPRRVRLPTYPFARERCWLGDAVSTPSAAASEARKTHEERVRATVSGLLGLPENRLDSERPLGQYGLDSILAMELRDRLRAEFGCETTLVEILRAGTIKSLAARVSKGASEPVARAESSLPVLVPDPAGRHDPFPLTDIQLAYVIGRDPGRELGNNGCHNYWEFDRESWDAPRLNAAWNTLVAHHDMLRAVVQPDGSQVVRPVAEPYQFPTHDVRSRAPREVEAHLRCVRERLSHETHDPARWPLFTIEITQLEDRVRLHLGFDLLIFDALSIFRVLNQWLRLYENPGFTPPSSPVSFRDYVLHLPLVRQGAAYAKAEAYWQKNMDALAPAPELPLACAPSDLRKPYYARRTATMPPDHWSRLKERARDAGLTDVNVMLAALAEVLTRWSRSPAYTLNLTIFNRLPVHPAVNQVVGDFTSTMLLGVDHRGNDSFRARALTLRDRLVEGLDHCLFNGVQVMRQMAARGREGRPRDAGFPVVFTSLLGFEGVLGEKPRLRGGFGTMVHAVTQTPQVWLDVQAYEEAGTLYLTWDSVEALFPEGLMDAMFEAFRELVDQLAGSDSAWDQPLLRVSLPAAQARARAVANATAAPLGEELLHTLFLGAARRHPDRAAVITAGETISYGELYASAAGLAERLRGRNTRANELVPVVMSKGWEQIAAVLGVQLAGAAYVPIDPSNPAARIRHLLEVTGARVAVTPPDPDGVSDWPADVARETVPRVPSQIPPDDFRPLQSPDDLAYVIFTSGSTGQPKGVMIDHRGAVNTVLDINERFEVGPQDRSIALSSLSFDLSVYDIFGLLATGGTVVMPDPERQADPAYLAELVRGREVTIWNTVPAFMQLFLRHLGDPPLETFPRLRLVMQSGDWVPVDLPERVRALNPAMRIVSLGGATEASIWSIFHPIDRVDPAWKSIPYGAPLRNQTFHVLDESLAPCPDWVPGGLYIGGSGLAKGYWRDPEKSAAGFIIHPRSGERLYRTGDLGRYWPGGVIEFLGREDFQVKVGGYRIELGEIEHALAEHPAVAECAVVARADERERKVLAGYWVAAAGQTATSPQILTFLQGKLPGYMTPATLTRLANLPLNGNEKVDRGALARGAFREPPDDATPPPSELPRKVSPGFQLLEDPNGIIMDKARRDAFQRTRPHLRHDLAGAETVPFPATVALSAQYHSWKTHRRYGREKLPARGFADFIGCLRGERIDGRVKRLYGSAGGLYPVQTYLYVKPDRIEGLRGGIYYYDPESHRLALIDATARLAPELHFPTNRPVFEASGFSIFLIAQMRAITPLYGAAGRDYCLLEAGGMAHLLTTTGVASGIGLCAVGSMRFDSIRQFFRLDEGHEFLYSLVGGGLPVPVAKGRSNDNGNGVALFKPAAPPASLGRDALASRLGLLWAETLKLEAVDPAVGFFELGGDSFSVLDLNRLINQKLPVACTVTDILSHPTVNRLAALLAGRQSNTQEPPSSPENESSEPEPATNGAGGSAFDQRRSLRKAFRRQLMGNR